MRLQGAIFQLPDALLDAAGVPRSGVKEFLSVMKMEGVWMYSVTDQSLEECRRALEGAIPGLKAIMISTSEIK